jgi:hypothetical protein
VKRPFKILTFLLFLLGAACSNQWREGEQSVSGDEMMAMLGEAQTNGAQSTSGGGGDLATAVALKDDAGSTVYFADAPRGHVPVAAVFAMLNLDFLGTGTMGLNYEAVQAVRIFFIDNPSQTALVLGVQMTGAQAPVADPNATGGVIPATQFTYYAFTGQGSSSDGTYSATLTGPNGSSITLESDDVGGDGLLMDVIQLRMYDSSGYFLGKFTSLTGYTQQ